MIPYQIVDGTAVIITRTQTGIVPITIAPEHPFHTQILQFLISGEHDRALELVDARAKAVEEAMRTLTVQVDNDTVSCDIDGNVTVNGLPLEPFIAKCVQDRATAGMGMEDLIRFRRRLNRNSVPKIKEQLFRFLNHGGFQLLPDGRFVAYKGVYKTDDPNIFASAHERDFYYELGVKTYENVKECNYNVDVACGAGLHVGTKIYARDYGDTMVEVFVDPAEVICVPTDGDGQKLRAKALFCNAVVDYDTEAPTSTIRQDLLDAGLELAASTIRQDLLDAGLELAADEAGSEDDWDSDDADQDYGSDDLTEAVDAAKYDEGEPVRTSKRTYYNTHTGATIRSDKNPGPGWSRSKPKSDPTPEPGPVKSSQRTYYNKLDGTTMRSATHPGPNWTGKKPKE